MRVYPKNDVVRKNLKHMPSGRGLGDDMSSGAEWPDDNFTRRRIRDGDLVLSQAVEQAERPAPTRRETRPEPVKAADKPVADKPSATHKTE